VEDQSQEGVRGPSKEQELGSIIEAGVEDSSQELEWRINHKRE